MATPALRARVLDPSEDWDALLAGTALANQPLPKDHVRVVVVEQGTEVVACWAAMEVVHLEGLWQAPDAGAGVSRALLTQMIAVLQEAQVVEALTQSLTPEVDRLIEKAGGRKVPGQTWVLPVQELE